MKAPNPMAASKAVMSIATIGGFFALKILVGIVLVVQSARTLSVSDFGVFSQLFLFLALLSTISAGGVQNGLIRQIALAKNNLDDERKSVGAALMIWVAFSATILSFSLIAAEPLSKLLVGNANAIYMVPAIAAAAMAAGGGQLLCAILTGRGRTSVSLILQGLGLAIGGGGCWFYLAAGDAQNAVIAYALAPIATLLFALPLTWRWLPRGMRTLHHLQDERRILLNFSGAFLLTATIMPITLFLLRYVYRIEFGEEALGYWLAANRVSDVSTQFLGLYMAQIYLPAVARRSSISDIKPLIRNAMAVGLAAMGGALAIFVAFSPLLIRNFLSPAFLSATPFIIGYLCGDIFRVVTSLSLHTALARGRFKIYVGVEVLTGICIVSYMYPLIILSFPESAYYGYVAAHATMAVLCLVGWRHAWWMRG